MSGARPTVLVLGPSLAAMSGVSTHVGLLLGSPLAETYDLVHFQVGSEGREEGVLAKVARFLTSPIALFFTILSRRVAIVHLNTSLNPRAYWRDLAYLLVARLAGARVVYQVHGGALPEHFFEKSRLLTAFLRMTLRIPDQIVVLAQCELRAYRAFIPEQDVIVIANGIDCRPFDGLGTVHSFEPVGESRELVIDAPQELAKFLAYKGSVVVNGVSLTVNRVRPFPKNWISPWLTRTRPSRTGLAAVPRSRRSASAWRSAVSDV